MISYFLLFLVLENVNSNNEKNSKELILSMRNQLSVNTKNILKLDNIQYKFINEVTKLKEDFKDLEEENKKLKAIINRKQEEKTKTVSMNAKQMVEEKFKNNNDDNNELFYILPINGFLWKISNISRFLKNPSSKLVSKTFYTHGNFGYKIFLKLTNSFNKVNLIFRTLDGKFDNLLPWPFNEEIEASILSQHYPYIHYTETNLIKLDTCLHRFESHGIKFRHIFSIKDRDLLSIALKDILIINILFNNFTYPNEDKIFNNNISWEIKLRNEMMESKIKKNLSKIFYTGDYGYKVKLVLHSNAKSFKKELNLFLTILKGEYDDFLWWPFKCNVVISILKKTETVDMCPTITKETVKRKLDSKIERRIYFNKTTIYEKYTSIIRNDQMIIQFKTKSQLFHILNTNRIEKRKSYEDFIWIIKDFENLKNKVKPIWSRIFSGSQFDYYFQFTLYLNGERNAKYRYASIFIYAIQGPYDNILPWPFSKKISLGILDKQNKTITNDIGLIQNLDSSAYVKPSNDHGVLIAYSRFMKLEKELMSKYILNDQLVIRLRVSN